MKSTPITPVLPSLTSSGTVTAPPSALAPPQAHLVLGKNKTTLPGASATFPTNRLERRHLSWPARSRLLPLPTLETTRPEPPEATPHPLDLHLFCHHPTPARAVRPPAWPCSPLSLPEARATLPWPAPSSPPPTPPRLRKDQSSPRSLGDDSLSFRFRRTQPGPLDIPTRDLPSPL